jgi:type IV pilus assembly protein PilM
MAEKPNAFHTLGLEISSSALKGAEISLRKGKPGLDRIFDISLSQAENTPSALKGKEGEILQQALSKNLSVTLLNPGEALVRQLEVKLKKVAAIDEVLTFQAEPLLPYAADQAVLDRVILGETQDGTLLTLLSVRKDHLKNHLDICHSLNIEPEVVSCPPAALAAFSHLFAPLEQPQFVVHITRTSVICVLVKGGKLLASQACFQGIHQLAQAFEKDREKMGLDLAFESLDFAEIKNESFESLLEAMEALRLDVTRTLYALAKQAKGEDISQILMTGDAGHLKNLAAFLCQPLNKPIVGPSSLPEFDLSSFQLEQFALAIGAALTALPNAPDEIDFRQGEYAFPNPWKRYQKPLIIYAMLCLALAASLYFLGNSYIKYQEDRVRREYAQLLESMHRPYTSFEKEYTAKLTGKKSPEEVTEIMPIEHLDRADIAARVRYLDKEIQSMPQSFPLLPNVPTVSDVFGWLSTHPNVVAKDPKTGAVKPLLQIENFSYTYVKRPEMTKKQEKYQVKVEIEFSSPTAKLAREFHDALIAPNAIVDPKGEVKWSTNRGLYRASFYLKDKTVYSS